MSANLFPIQMTHTGRKNEIESVQEKCIENKHAHRRDGRRNILLAKQTRGKKGCAWWGDDKR